MLARVQKQSFTLELTEHDPSVKGYVSTGGQDRTSATAGGQHGPKSWRMGRHLRPVVLQPIIQPYELTFHAPV